MATTNLGRVGLVNQGVYSASETYSKNDFVSDGNNSLYFSLQDNNTGHALSEAAWWSCFFDGTAANTAAQGATAAAQAATEAAAAAALVEQQVEGADVTLDVTGNHMYVCGELNSLNISSVENSTKLSIIRFTSGATKTQFSYPENFNITGWTKPEENTGYTICVLFGVGNMVKDE